MLSALIFAAVIGQAPQAQWYPLTSRPGWEGYGVPNGSELTPVKWRKISEPEMEWVLKWEKVPVDKEAPDAKAPDDPTMKPTQSIAPVKPVAVATATGDPYGFISWLNATRARHGLSPVGYDPNLASWAAANNAQQNARGMGHHIMGPSRRQNCAMGSSSSIGPMWLASPGHRANMLAPDIRYVGIAGSGNYWTLNAY